MEQKVMVSLKEKKEAAEKQRVLPRSR